MCSWVLPRGTVEIAVKIQSERGNATSQLDEANKRGVGSYETTGNWYGVTRLPIEDGKEIAARV